MSSLGRWPSGRAIAAAAALAFLGILIVTPGCSSDDAAGCDSSKCKPGNTCLPLDGETKCRKTCTSNTDAATSCPFNYACVTPDDGNPAFCVENTAKLEQKPTGQWGAPCTATLGIENPECDGAQEFYCYGTAPTDGAAYCTRYSCATDRDCAAGFWCADTNVGPNVTTTKRSIRDTEKVCLKRTYCSTCKADLDCPPVDGRTQRCVADDSGAGFCTPECTSTTNCNNEARCIDVGLDLREDGSIPKVCYPRAGVCVGDGALCAPCRSDLDCGEDGVCVKGQYTTERVCATKAPNDCDKGEGTAQSGCPKSLDNPKVLIACLGGRIDEVPVNYCHGFYEIGDNPSDTGCWTPNR